MDAASPGASAVITADRLRLFAPNCPAALLAPQLNRAARAYEITTPRRLRHWLAELHHESEGITVLEECLSYSAERMHQVWPARFPTLAAAEPYDHKPAALACKVYGGRLGNTQPMDGWTFRGRGLIQLTGRANYTAAARWSALDLVTHPELASTLAGAATIAGAFWAVHKLNAIVDAAPDDNTAVTGVQAGIAATDQEGVRQERRIINGGTLGLDDVLAQLKHAATIWPG